MAPSPGCTKIAPNAIHFPSLGISELVLCWASPLGSQTLYHILGSIGTLRPCLVDSPEVK